MNIRTSLKDFDSPIGSYNQDLLQRKGFVRQLCSILREASSTGSNVFALYGDWGSGKTSIKNLLQLELPRLGKHPPLAIDFNPWAFSAQDQVMDAFFSEVGKALGREPHGKKAGKAFKKVGAFLAFGAKLAKTAQLVLTASNKPEYAMLADAAGTRLEIVA